MVISIFWEKLEEGGLIKTSCF